MSNILVHKKQVITAGLAKLYNTLSVRRDENSPWVEAMTLPEMVEVLGVPRQTIETHMQTEGSFCRNSGETTAELRNQKVISLIGRPPRLVPKAAIESVVRFISTPETDAIYDQLWRLADNVREGNLEAAKELNGARQESEVTDSDILKVVLHLQKRTAIAEKRAFSSMGTAGAAVKAKNLAAAALAVSDAKVIELQTRLGEAENTKTAVNWKREYPILEQFQDSVLGKKLKAECELLALDFVEIPGPRYTTNAYPKAVVESFLAKLTK